MSRIDLALILLYLFAMVRSLEGQIYFYDKLPKLYTDANLSNFVYIIILGLAVLVLTIGVW